MTAKRGTLVVVILGVLLAGWWWQSDRGTSQTGEKLDLEPLVNRVWVDHLPTGARDKIDVFIMFDDPKAGAFATTSSSRGRLDFL